MSGNSVKGPTSALSSFLREKGIVAPRLHYGRRRATQDEEGGPDQPEEPASATATPAAPAQEPERTDDADPEDSGNQEMRRVVRPDLADQVIVIDIDVEPPSRSAAQPGSSSSSAQQSPSLKRKTTRQTSKKEASKKQKRKGDGDDDDDNDGDYNDDINSRFFEVDKKLAPRSQHSKLRNRRLEEQMDEMREDRIGAIRFCDRCQRKFVLENLGDQICQACFTLHGEKRANKIKRKAKTVMDPLLKREGSVLSLKSMCIKILVDYIEDIEQLGDISYESKQTISRIISRSRVLNNQTLGLFIGPDESSLDLYDCTLLDENGYTQISSFCPNLTHLNLTLCGRMNDHVIQVYARSFPRLTSLTLRGPYLVTDKAFAALFESLGDKLMKLRLESAAQLGFGGLSALVKNCPRLKSLHLDQCTSVGDAEIKALGGLTSVEELQLNYLGSAISDEALGGIIQTIGQQLSVLSLSGYGQMKDALLLDVIAPICNQLQFFSIANCESITDEGFEQFLNVFKRKGSTRLSRLDLSRVTQLGDSSLIVLSNLHCDMLQTLLLNGLEDLTERSLKALATKLPMLEVLDLSWVRNLEDELLEEFFRNCPRLKLAKLYGCNKLTEFTFRRRWTNAKGEPIELLGNEFD
ncbi:uncharacterized protein BJ171DRAFT_595611 [Polychytrium aggregatum]|uniref:uncharacterized protein n=1 Tax=Polychytrium aggregatum TaxID=110093 RepID=UPI0022FEAB57|nr:uncharacterized protein BJ171DRAFT_595611 [Polychytrium aggregatum]KAI9208454.1 hypothetical protein BJ171DRAFT_595611 [Polychytrium aggregatum]